MDPNFAYLSMTCLGLYTLGNAFWYGFKTYYAIEHGNSNGWKFWLPFPLDLMYSGSEYSQPGY
ncbi:MAG: hypothetical protein J4428_00380 [Candidatus Aenigmarchaeota archaeon]|nr:hypothetical protein [Candidatus Aenigmarchaeota archaeon]